MLDLSVYRLPLSPAPDAVLHTAGAGVSKGDFPPPTQAPAVLGGAAAFRNAMTRDDDGRLLITCVTEMTGVTPAMIDWWFGWHLTESTRYQLWHPTAHVGLTVKEDRTHMDNDRSRYIGNVSYVDEYIGKSLKKLEIAFKPPAHFGFAPKDLMAGTAICAETFDRSMNARGGYLVHYVVPTDTGAQMRSAFWLGYFDSRIPLASKILNAVVNTRLVRKAALPDLMAHDLLLHCGEEMNHLAKFLPALYAQVNQTRDEVPGN